MIKPIGLFFALAGTSLLCQAAMDDTLSERSDNLIELGMYSRSESKQEKGSLLPVPIPIANPTVGTGLAGALLYLHPKDADEPAATSGLGAFYTDSKSWFAGVFHDDYWLKDRLRFKAVAGTGELDLKYYGVDSDPELEEDPINYTIRPKLALIQLLGRIVPNSNWYIGGRYLYSSAEVTFQLKNDLPEPPNLTSSIVTSSLGLITSYDSRNDNYYPTAGHFFEGIYSRDDEAWGSDFKYSKFSGFYNYYFPVTNTGVIATRLWVSNVSGDAPFFMLPTLNMRGFVRGRYRNNSAVSAHIEWRHKFKPRWAYILFTELGNTAASFNEIFETSSVKTFGAGIRWQVLADKNLNIGADFGFSDDDRALYIQVGERF